MYEFDSDEDENAPSIYEQKGKGRKKMEEDSESAAYLNFSR